MPRALLTVLTLAALAPVGRIWQQQPIAIKGGFIRLPARRLPRRAHDLVVDPTPVGHMEHVTRRDWLSGGTLDFPSLDYTLSFHVGLMMRMRSRERPSDEPTPFDEVFRRQQQAHTHLDAAVEVEDLQAVGMMLREGLLSLLAAVRRRVEIPAEAAHPKDADFIAWSDLLMDRLLPGDSNKDLRSYMKGAAKRTWQVVNWLTHAHSATETAASISTQACDVLVGHFISLVEREQIDHTEKCPNCKSRDIRSHFDPAIGADGDYYLTCGACEWSSHPGTSDDDEDAGDEGQAP